MLRSILETLPETEILEAATLDEALALAKSERFDVYLVDIHLSSNLAERAGIEFVRRTRSVQPAPAVMVSGSVEIQDLREAMRAGAADYVLKDQLSPEMILPIVSELLAHRDLNLRVEQLGQRLDRTFGLGAIVGISPGIERVRQLIRRLADAEASVLVRGPNGTGKELVAQALHQISKRASEPLIPVNCAAIAPTLVESELFGHEKGAFTHALSRRRGCLEQAGRGTLFLDEIAELTPDLQAKLLRVLEARRFQRVGGTEHLPFQARIVAATHQDLEQRIQDGRFREDLYYRLNVVSIAVPPLSDRREDIPLLAAHFVAQHGRPLTFDREVMDWLMQHSWPGNVRELRNLMVRLVLLSEQDHITLPALFAVAQPGFGDKQADDAAELERLARRFLAPSFKVPGAAGDGERVDKLALMEETLVRIAMELSGNVQSAAARLLGIDRKALDRRYHKREKRSASAPSQPGATDE